MNNIYSFSELCVPICPLLFVSSTLQDDAKWNDEFWQNDKHFLQHLNEKNAVLHQFCWQINWVSQRNNKHCNNTKWTEFFLTYPLIMLKDNVLLNTKLETCLVRFYLNISDTRPKTKNRFCYLKIILLVILVIYYVYVIILLYILFFLLSAFYCCCSSFPSNKPGTAN